MSEELMLQSLIFVFLVEQILQFIMLKLCAVNLNS